MKILLTFLLTLCTGTSCIYMDARTGCTESRVEMTYAVTDSQEVSMSPSTDYHREGTASNTNSARQDGRLSAVGVGDAALKAITETVAECYTLGANKAVPLLTQKLGRVPSSAELDELAKQLPTQAPQAPKEIIQLPAPK